VRLFLVGDGVRWVDLGVDLAARGVEVSLCEADAALRGIHKSAQRGVFFGSLYDWSRLAEDADQVLSFA
jgi:sulfur relay (sulfurtransferase) complex TusBCD TusD component (DsrE family)